MCSGTGLSRSFHEVTIVDMGELPEVSVSIADLSRLREQWLLTVLRHMVWLQQDLDTMRAEARRRFRNTRPGRCSYCDKIICIVTFLHIIWTWRSCGGARFHGVRYGRVRHRTAWIMFGGHMMCRGMLG